MKTSLSIFVALVAVTFAPISSAPAQVARYRVVDPTAEIPGVNQSWGMDLNDQGLAVGTFVADDWKRQYVFAWQNGQLVEVLQPQPQNPSTQPPGLLEVHRYLRATGVNDDGVIVGDAYHYSFGVFHLGFFAPVPAASWPPPLYLGTTNDFRGWWTQAVSDTDPMLVVGMGQVRSPSMWNSTASRLRSRRARDRSIPQVPRGSPHSAPSAIARSPRPSTAIGWWSAGPRTSRATGERSSGTTTADR